MFKQTLIQKLGYSNSRKKMFSDKQTTCLNYLEGCDEVTEVFYGGSAGGGKTWLGCHWQIARRINYPGTRGLIGRSKLKNLKLTTLKTFEDVWRDFYIDNPYGVTYNLNNQDNVITFSNGSEIYLKDLFQYPSDKDFTSLGSMEISDAFLDEVTEITEKAFNIISSRIRYNLIDGVPKILSAGNPANNWVKFRYIKSKEGKEIEIKDYQKVVIAKLSDNPNEVFKKVYQSQLEKLDSYDVERLLHGNWDVILSENPFFSSFSRDKHFTLEDYEPIKNQPLILSFDFNINPTTLLVSQYDATKGELHIFDLFLTTPNTIKGLSPIEAACELFNKKYIESGLFTAYQLKVTGDASGSAGSADRKIADTYYSTIERSLKTKNVVIRKSNIEHVTSGRMINSLLRGMPKGAIYIHGLIALVSDIEIAYSDENGTLNKAKKEFGLHIVDAFRYLFDMVYLMPLKDIREMEKKINGLILQYEGRINRRT
jgi:phage terminase large subunit